GRGGPFPLGARRAFPPLPGGAPDGLPDALAAPAGRPRPVVDRPQRRRDCRRRRLRVRSVLQSRVQATVRRAARSLPKSQPRPLSGMIGGMRVKTWVTTDERVLKAIDKATPRTRSRSRVIEDAAREFLARRARAAREARDLAILNESAAALNAEMEDVLAYQADV